MALKLSLLICAKKAEEGKRIAKSSQVKIDRHPLYAYELPTRSSFLLRQNAGAGFRDGDGVFLVSGEVAGFHDDTPAVVASRYGRVAD